MTSDLNILPAPSRGAVLFNDGVVVHPASLLPLGARPTRPPYLT